MSNQTNAGLNRYASSIARNAPKDVLEKLLELRRSYKQAQLRPPALAPAQVRTVKTSHRAS